MNSYHLYLTQLICFCIGFTNMTGLDFSLPLTIHRIRVGDSSDHLCEGVELHRGFIVRYVWIAALAVIFFGFVSVLFLTLFCLCGLKKNNSGADASRLTEEAEEVDPGFHKSKLRLETDSKSPTEPKERKDLEEKRRESVEDELPASMRHCNADLRSPPFRRDALGLRLSRSVKIVRFSLEPENADDVVDVKFNPAQTDAA